MAIGNESLELGVSLDQGNKGNERRELASKSAVGKLRHVKDIAWKEFFFFEYTGL